MTTANDLYLHLLQVAPRPYHLRAQRLMDSTLPEKKKVLVLTSYLYEAQVETSVREMYQEHLRSEQKLTRAMLAY